MSKPFVERNDYWFYGIVCNDEDIYDFYIGSTKDWDGRKRKHKQHCSDGTDFRVYEYINGYGGWNECGMVITSGNIAAHRKRANHFRRLNQQN